MTTALIAHAENEASFVAALRGARVPHAWLLSGPEGVGKASFAVRAAAFLLDAGDERARAGATTLDLPPDSEARRWIESGAHPDFLRLERQVSASRKGGEELARNITVDQVRETLARMRTKPSMSAWRAVVIDAIDDCEAGAANALLKTLEEPPDRTVIFLVSHAPGRLLPTIRSRCRHLRFGALPEEAVAAVIADALPALDAAERAELVRLGQGSPGRALSYGELGLAETARMLADVVRTGDADNQLRCDLARKLSAGSDRSRFTAVLAQAQALAADEARGSAGDRLARALAAYDSIVAINRFALTGSEDVTTVTHGLCRALATIGARNS